MSTRLEKYEEHNEPYRSGTNLVSYKIYLQNIVTNNKNAENYKKELLFIPFVMAQSIRVLVPKPLQTEILSECDKSVILGLMTYH